MNIKILSILGILSVATVSYVSFADDTEVVLDEEDEELDEEFEDDEDWEEDEEEEEVTETRVVAARLTCNDINERVSELREDVKSHPELKEELETMLVRQRTQCAPRANRRPVRNYENVNPVMTVDAEPVEEEPEEEVVEKVESKPKKKVVEKEPVKTPEEIAVEAAEQERKIAENIANGLCGDGAKPNRYGCCEGEKFKEISQMQFACCPKDGDGECHEPLGKKAK